MLYHNQNPSTGFSQKPIGISVATVLSSTHGQKLNEEVAGSPTQNNVDIIKLDESEIIEPEVSAPLLGKNTCYRAKVHISIEHNDNYILMLCQELFILLQTQILWMV